MKFRKTAKQRKVARSKNFAFLLDQHSRCGKISSLLTSIALHYMNIFVNE